MAVYMAEFDAVTKELIGEPVEAGFASVVEAAAMMGVAPVFQWVRGVIFDITPGRRIIFCDYRMR